jgi:hypothetical protein
MVDDVAGPQRIARDHVLGRGHDPRDLDGHVQLAERAHDPEHGCSTGHVRLHLLHGLPRLEREPTRVERDSLAYQGDPLERTVGRIAQSNQPGRLARAGRDAQEAAEAELS